MSEGKNGNFLLEGGKITPKMRKEQGLPAPLLIGGGAVLVAALTALSYRASVRFYRNRRSGLYN